MHSKCAAAASCDGRAHRNHAREGMSSWFQNRNVITKNENGKILERWNMCSSTLPEEKIGIIAEKLSARKGKMTGMENHGHGRVDLEFDVLRGLIGFGVSFLRDTNGAGVMNSLFMDTRPGSGLSRRETSGAIVATARKGDRVRLFRNGGSRELLIESESCVCGMVIGERTGRRIFWSTSQREKTHQHAQFHGGHRRHVAPARLLSLDSV